MSAISCLLRESLPQRRRRDKTTSGNIIVLVNRAFALIIEKRRGKRLPIISALEIACVYTANICMQNRTNFIRDGDAARVLPGD